MKKKTKKMKKKTTAKKKKPAKKAAKKRPAARKKKSPARRKPFRWKPAPAVVKPAEKPAKFTPAELADIRAALEKKREELYAAYRQTKQMTFNQDGSDGTHDSGDVASSTYAREFLLTLNDSELQLLRQIDEAIERLDRRKYGLCAACRAAIPAKRLQWIPWATLCMACQSSAEAA